MIRETVDLVVQGVKLNVAAIYRDGEGAPIVFLHGFGSTKEDYADILRHPTFAGRPFVAYDAPGCGETVCHDLSKISIPFLVEAAKAMLKLLGIDRFYLVGHSMGGLTALMLAHEEPNRVVGFISIEGNLAPEDCFLSRQIFEFPASDAERFFEDFIDRVWHSPFYSCPLYAASLRCKVRVNAVSSIFMSVVELSDHADLLTKFLSLPCPRMFMYGDQNAGLSYLPRLQAGGVTLVSIPRCGHFPMYSNPVEMWARIAAFLETKTSSDAVRRYSAAAPASHEGADCARKRTHPIRDS
jgi:pimeloyl-ACP methyl ester carboxylesterase